jgi:iron complex transport system substrate-binding protein
MKYSRLIIIFVILIFTLTFPCFIACIGAEALPIKPQRIVVLAQCAEDILLEMIGPDRIVGISHQYFKNKDFPPLYQLIKDIEGKSLTENNIEGILDVAPDLVILSDMKDIPYYLHADRNNLLTALEQADIPYIVLDIPSGFVDVISAIRILGELLDETQKAAQMVSNINVRLEQLSQLVSLIPEQERITAMHFDTFYTTRLLSCYNEIAAAAGVIPLGVSEDAIQIAELAPDLITVEEISLRYTWRIDYRSFEYEDKDGNIYFQNGGNWEVTRDILLAQPLLSNVPAIQNNNIHMLRLIQSQFMIDVAEELAKLAYPYLFE